MKIFYFFIIIFINSYEALSKEYICTTVSTDRIIKIEVGQEEIKNSNGTIKFSEPIKTTKQFFGRSHTDMKITLDDGYIKISYLNDNDGYDLIVDKVVSETERFLNIQFKPLTYKYEKESGNTTGTLYFNKINKKAIIDRTRSSRTKTNINGLFYSHDWLTTIDKHKFDCATYN